MGDAVPMTSLERLLDLQATDTRIDQLEHRRRTLPERARLERLAEQRQAVLDAAAGDRAQHDELARAQKRLEDEIAGVEAKAAGVDRQLYGGGITSPKEAQALQADLESLKRRQADLEDQLLELMEQAEPLDERLGRSASTVAAIDAEREAVTADLAAAETEVDGQLGEARGAREELTTDLPHDLLASYERLRSTSDGVAVARLAGNTCQGCHLALAPAEVDRLRHEPPEAVVHCPECMRILVR
jgi:predicted  nucleic acid-binding Zn-ribbon protein